MATYPPPPSHPSKTSSKTLFQESIEMNTFSGPHAALDETPDAVSLWAYTTSSALVLLALPLFAFPRLVMFLMGGLDDVKGGEVLERRDALTPLERFLCFQIALLMVALACLVLLLTAPPPPHIDPAESKDDKFRPPSRLSSFSASRSTTITILTPLLLISSFTSYYSPVGSLGVFFSILTAVGGFFGAWVGLFGSESSYLSKSTGADKRTASFPFKNASAAKEIKKKWREEKDR